MKLSSIDLNLLMAFEAIVDTSSVSRAAERVGLSKPAMSHALSRLRAQVGDHILVRSGQGWQLTARAETLAPRIRAVLEEARGMLSPERFMTPAELRRDFRIHTTDYVLTLLGTAIGHEVSRQAPAVGLRFLPLEAEDAPALRRGSSDLAIGPAAYLPSEFRMQQLFTDHFACAVRKQHPAITGRLTLKQFVEVPHVMIDPRGKPCPLIDEALAARGLKRRVARSVPYFLSALDLVSQSDCLVMILDRLGRRHADRFGLKLLSPPLPLPQQAIYQVWHPRVDGDPAHKWLRGLIAQQARSKR